MLAAGATIAMPLADGNAVRPQSDRRVVMRSSERGSQPTWVVSSLCGMYFWDWANVVKHRKYRTCS